MGTMNYDVILQIIISTTYHTKPPGFTPGTLSGRSMGPLETHWPYRALYPLVSGETRQVNLVRQDLGTAVHPTPVLS